MSENARLIQQPEVGSIEGNVQMNTSPIKNIFEGNLSFSLDALSRYDIRSKKSPIADIALTVSVNVDAPAGTFGTPSDASAREKATLNLQLIARSLDRVLALQIPVLEADAPLMASAFSLPQDISKTWYGSTYDELNASLKEAAMENGNEQQLPKVEEIIGNMFGSTRVSPEAMKRAAKKMHLWNGIEVLPEEDGNLHIRVESDKKKILRSVKAALDYVEEVSGSSWDAQLNNPQFREMVTGLKGKDAEFLKTMGSVKGIISVEKDTYIFRGFVGDAMDESGSITGHMEMLSTAEGDFKLSITDVAEQSTMLFTKKGADLSFVVDDKQLMKGTWEDKKLNLAFTNEADGKSAGSLMMTLKEYDKTHLIISEARITIADPSMVITVKDFMVAVNEAEKESSMSATFSASYEGKNVLSGSMVSKKKEIPDFSLEKPVFKPLKDLQADFYQALLGSQEVMIHTEEGLDEAR